MSFPEVYYQIALTQVPKIGCITAKRLLAYVGSAEGIFKDKKGSLLKIPGIGKTVVDSIKKESTIWEVVEKELEFIAKYYIQTVFYLDKEYPERLKHCEDGPILLFMKGAPDFNKRKTLSIVGTRNNTPEGKDICEKLVTQLAERNHDVMIISGLAYGIDIIAHRAALKHKLETVAVLGHGLGTLYPALHSATAKEIVGHGALVSEFLSHEQPDRPNFVKRNRIIAGLADATVVIESGPKGGALITAEIANSYNRDVFAFPGKPIDHYSKGCNALIKSNKAALIEGVEDLEYQLGWNQKNEKNSVQRQLFVELNEQEKEIQNILKEENELSIDILSLRADIPTSRISSILLNMEFSGVIKCLPGKIYCLVE